MFLMIALWPVITTLLYWRTLRSLLPYLRRYRARYHLDLALPGDPPELTGGRYYFGWPIYRYMFHWQRDPELEVLRREALRWWHACVAFGFVYPTLGLCILPALLDGLTR